MRWRDMKPRDRAAERWELWVRPAKTKAAFQYVAGGLLAALLETMDEWPGHDCSFRDVTDQPLPPAMT